MKKTLIALAAVAATGAAFAQSTVTLSGAVSYGYQATKTNNVGAKGFGLDTSEVHFKATEDLGGGLKAAAAFGVGDAAGFGDQVTAMNTSLSLSGGFGSLLLGQIQIGSGIRGLAQAGAPVNNMEGEVLAAAVALDIVKYTAPKMGGFVFSGSLTEGTGLANGLGQNQPRTITLGVDYAAGPIAAKFDYSDYSKHPTNNWRYRVAGSYDFGMAKVGAGYESIKRLNNTGKNNYTMLGVSVPVGGAFTVGAAWVKNDITTVAGDKTGYTLGAEYALSKRTSVTASYARWDNAEGGTVKDTKTTILLNHSF